jgi:hypothetical protein
VCAEHRAVRWWTPWAVVVLLLTSAVLLPRVFPDLARVRRQMQAQRCREQMLALAEGEVQHYLDHRAFTTEQVALTRYVPYAEHARCPVCGAPYVLEVSRDLVRVRCPCADVHHGLVEQPAPSPSDSTAPPPGKSVLPLEPAPIISP